GEARVSFPDPPTVAALVQLRDRPAADGVHFRMRMILVDRDELGAEPQADDGHADLAFVRHVGRPPAKALALVSGPAACRIVGPCAEGKRARGPRISRRRTDR